MPSGQRLMTAYQDMIELADELLHGPITVETWSWEDGDIEIRAWHTFGGVESIRAELQYHSAQDGVKAAIWRYEGDERKELMDMWQLDRNVGRVPDE